MTFSQEISLIEGLDETLRKNRECIRIQKKEGQTGDRQIDVKNSSGFRNNAVSKGENMARIRDQRNGDSTLVDMRRFVIFKFIGSVK